MILKGGSLQNAIIQFMSIQNHVKSLCSSKGGQILKGIALFESIILFRRWPKLEGGEHFGSKVREGSQFAIPRTHRYSGKDFISEHPVRTGTKRKGGGSALPERRRDVSRAPGAKGTPIPGPPAGDPRFPPAARFARRRM